MNSSHMAFAVVLLAGLLEPVFGQYWNDFDEAPHNYRSRKLVDPVTLFMDKVDSGEKVVDEANGKPLLARLLKEFDIPVSSQILVFTKTSLQREQVSVQNPRALYFNEDVYLGWMPGGRIEIASVDPHVGPVFYFQRPLNRPDDLLLRKNRNCLGCHAGSATNYLPGLLGRSIYPAESGRSMGAIRSFERIGHAIPYNERWGGWMVTGHGLDTLPHMANAIAKRGPKGLELDRKTEGAGAEDLSIFYPQDIHLTPGSDLLAMLAHDHQISAHYYMNVAQFKWRQAMYDNKLPLDSGREVLEELKSSDRRDVNDGVSWFLRYFLFARESPLGGKPISGHGGYRKDFMANKRVSRSGKSLKDLDLTNHLLQNRLSWMIYSNAFEGLQPALKQEFYHRLWEILTLPGGVKGYRHLEEQEKKNIIEILADTKKDLPEFWKVQG